MAQTRIVIVEDEPLLAMALRRALQCSLHAGCEIDISPRGVHALARIENGQIDLLITDQCMPGMSGLDLIRQVKGVSPRTGTMLITAFGSDSVQDQVRQLGAVYLPKPFKLARFISVVEETIEKSRANTETVTVDGGAPR